MVLSPIFTVISAAIFSPDASVTFAAGKVTSLPFTAKIRVFPPRSMTGFPVSATLIFNSRLSVSPLP